MKRVRIGEYAVAVPKDFSLVSFSLSSPLQMSGSTPYATTLVCARETVPAGTTLEQYVLNLTDKLRRAPIPARRGNKLPRRVTLESKAEGMLLEQSLTAPGDVLVEQLVLVTLQADVAYVVTASSLGGEPFAQQRPQLEQCLLTFTATPGAAL